MQINPHSTFIYQQKLEVYSYILGELKKLILMLEVHVAEAKEYNDDPEYPVDDEFAVIDNQGFKVDDACETFNKYLISHSLIIPPAIYHQLSLFCDNVLASDSIDTEHLEAHQITNKIARSIDALIKEADTISIAMRKDLELEPLQDSLFRRLPSEGF